MAAQANDYNKALELFDKSGDWDPLLKAEWLAGAGKREEANQLLEREMKQDPNEVLPLATWIHINASLSSLDTLRGKFDQLRTLASTADLNTPLLARLNKVAQSFGLPNDWRSPEPARADIGARPALDTLGPIHWQPYTAPSFELTRNDGQPLNSSSLQGKPTVLIFYLGSGCLHCVKQLQKFNEQREEFEKAGIQLLAISTEDLTQLQEGIRNYEKPISIPLLADPSSRSLRHTVVRMILKSNRSTAPSSSTQPAVCVGKTSASNRSMTYPLSSRNRASPQNQIACLGPPR